MLAGRFYSGDEPRHDQKAGRTLKPEICRGSKSRSRQRGRLHVLYCEPELPTCWGATIKY